MKKKFKKIVVALVAILMLTSSLSMESTINVKASDDHYFFNCKNTAYKVYVKTLNATQVKADCTSVVVRKNGSIQSRNLIDFGDESNSTATLANLKNTSLYDKTKKTYTINHMVLTHAHIDHVKGLEDLYNEMRKNKNIKVNIGTLYLNYVYLINNDKTHNHYDLLAVLKKLASLTGRFSIEKICVFTRYNYDISNFNVKEKLSGLAKLAKNAKGKASAWTCINTIKKFDLGGGVYMTILPAITKFNNGQPDDDVNNSTLMVVIKDQTKGTNKTGNFKIDITSDLKVNTKAGKKEGVEKLLEKDSKGNYVYKNYLNELAKKGFEELIFKMPHHGVFGYTAYQKSTFKNLFTVLEPTVVVGTGWTVDGRQNSYKNCRSFINTLNNGGDYQGPFIEIQKTFNNISYVY